MADAKARKAWQDTVYCTVSTARPVRYCSLCTYDTTFLQALKQPVSDVLLHKPRVMQDTARQEGRVFVAPYDDPFTIAGQGTIGTEILRQLTTSQLETLHAIFVPVGGGGLIAGIAAYVKALKPGVKIIGVEPSGRI